MTTEEKLDRLTEIVNTLASIVEVHHNRLDVLRKLVEKKSRPMAATDCQWHAYIGKLPAQ
jgi:hypothetical protein